MGAAGITRVLGRRRHPVVTRPPVLGVVRHAGLRAIRRAVGTPERRAHDRATFRKPLPNRCFCECRRHPWRRLAHATTPQRTVNGESDDFSSRSIPAHRTGTRRGRRSLWGAGIPRSREPASFAAVAPFGAPARLVRVSCVARAAVAPFGAPACLVRSDSPRLLKSWRVCPVVVTVHCCAPAFLAGCGTRSARHAAPPFPRRPNGEHCVPRGHSLATRRPRVLGAQTKPPRASARGGNAVERT